MTIITANFRASTFSACTSFIILGAVLAFILGAYLHHVISRRRLERNRQQERIEALKKRCFRLRHIMASINAEQDVSMWRTSGTLIAEPNQLKDILQSEDIDLESEHPMMQSVEDISEDAERRASILNIFRRFRL